MIQFSENKMGSRAGRPGLGATRRPTIAQSNHHGHDGARSPEHRDLGAAVAELRERHGLSRAEVADRAELRRSHLAAIERGAVDPTFVTLVRIVRAIPAPLAELFELFERRRAEAPNR
ncbi:MAG TPA: helix-turn-helix transcriptional regulator [Conexibacter sp.]|nr:helix-turn-helix transcriptional regulator [Conexibacter sp.]